MQKNEIFKTITEQIMSRRLGKAIDTLENWLLSHPQQYDMEQLQVLKTEYQLMSNYWQQGFDDPKREQLFDQLLRRLFVQASNICLNDCLRREPFLLSLYSRPRRNHKSWTTDGVRNDLENFVSEVAMLSLESGQQREQKSAALYQEHEKMMNDLFDYIWTSHQWKDSLANSFEEMLLSPTVDLIDQQLIVSAITLSAMNNFDFNKFRVLCHVYSQATDDALRQRALVGWVLCLDDDKARLYTEMRDMVAQLCEDERCRNELSELQVQMAYCIGAENDTRTIQREIMPELLKNGNLHIRKNKLEEIEEDSLEEILHPDAADEKMERLENSVRRMVSMQKQGSDIYFGGFSQMKRFPFFDHISNWFVPFYPQHPVISKAWTEKIATKFMHSIISVGAFCDSDKYSFVLAYNDVIDRMPENVKQMVQRGEAMPVGGEVSDEEQHSPVFIRRMYLQNLYRFFRLYPMRGEFSNPFVQGNDSVSIAFFGNSLFQHTQLETCFDKAAAFLLQRKLTSAAKCVLDNYRPEVMGYHYYMMMGRMTMMDDDLHGVSYRLAKEFYSNALELKPESEKAHASYARAAFANKNYQEALSAYQWLMAEKPDNGSYQLNAAVCMTFLEQYDEAQKLLYKLNYETPDDSNVKRALAWVLADQRQFEQAKKLYAQLMSEEEPQPDDMLNYGYCLWFAGNVEEAVGMFQRFLNKHDDSDFSMQRELLDTEAQRLQRHGISTTQALLMLDAIGA